jgi:hypothetical protein
MMEHQRPMPVKHKNTASHTRVQSTSPSIHTAMMHLPLVLPHLVPAIERSASNHTTVAHGLNAPVFRFVHCVGCHVMSLELREATERLFTTRVLAHDLTAQTYRPDDGVNLRLDLRGRGCIEV